MKFFAFLQLMRPANIVTAVADILLGVAAAGSLAALSGPDGNSSYWSSATWLILATCGLYGGGVVLNDVFDAELDSVERPERPIPSGRISLRAATVGGIFLLLAGVMAAGQVGVFSTLVAGLTAMAAVWYDAFGKHHPVFGPLNMGICRGLNLVLGMSIAGLAGVVLWLPVIPIIYVAAITIISRGEVHGTPRKWLYLGMGLYLLVMLLIAASGGNKIESWPFLLLFGASIFPPLFKAINTSQPKDIGKAVKAGVLSLILMNAALAVGFANWQYALFILLLLPVSLLLARFFAVT